ncbi:PadR family transcriptional regulator [candidate division KSB1 bacterium]
MKDLTIPEQIILTAIWRLNDNAYGVTIRKKVEEVTQKKLIYGTLYNFLDQLVRKRYVTKTRGMPTSERGGRSKMYYKLTPTGINALERARELQRSIWDGIPESMLEY